MSKSEGARKKRKPNTWDEVVANVTPWLRPKKEESEKLSTEEVTVDTTNTRRRER